MNEGAKQAYLDRAAAQFREWVAKVDVVKARFAQGVAGIRIGFHTRTQGAWNQLNSLINTVKGKP